MVPRLRFWTDFSFPVRFLFDGNPFALEIAGTFATDLGRELFAESDVVIAAGAGLGHYTTEGGYLFPNAKVVRIDTQPRGLWQGLRTADLHVQADARAARPAAPVAQGHGLGGTPADDTPDAGRRDRRPAECDCAALEQQSMVYPTGRPQGRAARPARPPPAEAIVSRLQEKGIRRRGWRSNEIAAKIATTAENPDPKPYTQTPGTLDPRPVVRVGRDGGHCFSFAMTHLRHCRWWRPTLAMRTPE
jgi:hypothetical protein